MRIDQFEYLVDLKKTGSITKTAEKFFVSRQVVSHALRTMENELDANLLIRDSDGISFTTAGEIAIEKAQKIVDAYGEFLNAVSNFNLSFLSDNDHPSLTIITIPRCMHIVSSVTSKYQKTNPTINFNLLTKTSNEIIHDFPPDDNVIGIISYIDAGNGVLEDFQLADKPHLTITPFIEAQFYICMSKHSKYNTKPIFSHDDLKNLPILSYTDSTFNLLPTSRDFTIPISSEVSDFHTLCTLINQDIGVGLVTLQEYNNLMNGKNFILTPLKDTSKYTVYFAYVLNEKSKENANVQKIASLIKHIL